MRNARRTGVVGLAIAGLVLTGATHAQAADEVAVAAGSIGAVDVVLDGEVVEVDPIAECATGDTAEGSSGGVEVEDFVSYDGGETTCAIDPETGFATAEVSGDRFRMDGLRQYGGPLIRMSSFTATCSTTETGSNAQVWFRGLTGIPVPPQLPANHVVTIPGPGTGAPPLATVTFNESIVPDPPDGSMTVNLMHIRLFPQGPADEVGGDVIVGQVHCAPF